MSAYLTRSLPRGAQLQLGARWLAVLAAALLALSLASGARAATVAAGIFSTCAVQTDGTVSCWGGNDDGELGTGQGDALTPQTVPGVSNAIAVTAGNEHTCALSATGTVQCWGYGLLGQLGQGSITSSPVPVQVVGITDAVQIAASGYETCALHVTGTISCWGQNVGTDFNGMFTQSPTPEAIPGVTNATGVVVTQGVVCAGRPTGTTCWTHDRDIGTGATMFSLDPIVLPDRADVAAISANCVARTSGAAGCWGFSNYGQLGNGTIGGPYVPQSALASVTGVTDAVSVTSGQFFGCVLHRAGTVGCWGYNAHGELGNGTNTDSALPVAVSGVNDATQLTAAPGGGDHTCVAHASGTVSCWGYNGRGQFGDGNTTNSAVPVTVPGVLVPTPANYPAVGDAGTAPTAAAARVATPHVVTAGVLPGGTSPADTGTKLGFTVGAAARSAARAAHHARWHGGLLALSGFLVRTGAGGKCAARAQVTFRAGSATLQRRLVVSKRAQSCVINAAVQTSGKLARAHTVGVTTAVGGKPSTPIAIHRS